MMQTAEDAGMRGVGVNKKRALSPCSTEGQEAEHGFGETI